MAALLIRDVPTVLHKKIRNMAVDAEDTVRNTAIKLLRKALAMEKSKSK